MTLKKKIFFLLFSLNLFLLAGILFFAKPRQPETSDYIPPHRLDSFRSFFKVYKKYGFDRLLLVTAVSSRREGVFYREFAALWAELTQKLAQISGVRSVVSAATVPSLWREGETLQVSILWKELLKRGETRPDIPEKISNDPLLRGHLISSDGRAVLALLIPQPNADLTALAGRVESLLSRYRDVSGVKLGVLGEPFVESAFRAVDFRRIFFLIFLGIILYFFFLSLALQSFWAPVFSAALWLSSLALALSASLGQLDGKWYFELFLSGVYLWLLSPMVLMKFSENSAEGRLKLSVLAALGGSLWTVGVFLGSSQPMGRVFIALGWANFALLLFYYFAADFAEFQVSPSERFPSKSLLAGLMALLLVPLLMFGDFDFRVPEVGKFYPSGSFAARGEEIFSVHFGASTPVFAVFSGDLNSPAHLKVLFRLHKILDTGEYPVQSYANLLALLNYNFNSEYKIPDRADQIGSLRAQMEGVEQLRFLVSSDLREALLQLRGIPSAESLSRAKGLLEELRRSSVREFRSDSFRIRWVLEGVSLWFRRHLSYRLTELEERSISRVLARFLRKFREDKVVPPAPLFKELKRFLSGEDFDLELTAVQQKKLLHQLLKLNLQGKLLSRPTVKSALEGVVKSPEDREFIGSAAASIVDLARRVRRKQLLWNCQQEVIRAVISGGSGRYLEGQLRRLRARELAFAQLEGELAELFAPELFSGSGGWSVSLRAVGLPLVFQSVEELFSASFWKGWALFFPLFILLSFALLWLSGGKSFGVFNFWWAGAFGLLGAVGWSAVIFGAVDIFIALFLVQASLAVIFFAALPPLPRNREFSLFAALAFPWGILAFFDLFKWFAFYYIFSLAFAFLARRVSALMLTTGNGDE